MIKKSTLALSLLVLSASGAQVHAEENLLKDVKIGGGSAVALAVQLSETVPGVKAQAKTDLKQILENSCKGAAKAKTANITISAGRIYCSEDHASIGTFYCSVDAAAFAAELSGRKAHELYATLVAAGVVADSVTGRSVAVATDVTCTVAPKGVAACDGSWEAANCTFKAMMAN